MTPGRRVLRAARTQLREAANDALANAFVALEARVLSHGAAGSRGRPRGQLERMREVLERDRALASATLVEAVPSPKAPPAPVPAPVPAASTAAPAAPVCDEPIRTRSMAKLLAAQGYAERALSIYTYLLAQGGGDPALQAEAAALRESQLHAADQDE